MSDTRSHRPADPFPAAGDPRPDAPAPVAQFGPYRFRRELAKVQAEFERLEATAVDRAAIGEPVVLLPRHLRLVS